MRDKILKFIDGVGIGYIGNVVGIVGFISVLLFLLSIWGNVATNTREIGDVRVEMERGLADNTVAIEKVFTAVSTEGNRVSTDIVNLSKEVVRDIYDSQ